MTEQRKIRVFVPDEPEDHVQHLTALAEGHPDAEVIPLSHGYVECDLAVVFGVGKRQVPQSHARGAIIYEHRFRERKPIIIVERGFVNRAEYYGVALNGLNGLGDFRNEDSPPDRWEKLGVEIKPWKKGGKYALICGQVPWDASVQHSDHIQWCRDVWERVEGLEIPVRFRPHPEVKGKIDYGLPEKDTTWDEDLADAMCVISYNSTAGALAALEGIPVFAMDPGSMAWPISNKELTKEALEAPVLHDREQWAYNLAYAQWTAEEMRQGIPWQRLL